MSPDVLVIGGGVAGLVTAVDCASRGFSVLLVEQKPHLGGRTYSFLHRETGDEVDNGQHLMMGCYHSTLRYLRTINSSSTISIQENLSITFRGEGGKKHELRTAPLVQPFNALVGMLRLQSLSLKNRIALLRFGVPLLFANPDTDTRLQSLTVTEWLDELHQPEDNKKYLWNIIAIGTLNDAPEKISAALFLKVLQSVFLGPRSNSVMVIPHRGLSAVLVDNAAEYIEHHGGKILLNTSVQSMSNEQLTVNNVVLSSGEVLQPNTVVCAVPYFDISKLFDETMLRLIPELHTTEQFVSSPIVTVHLWFDTHFMEEEFAALLDSPIHWVFNHVAPRRHDVEDIAEGGSVKRHKTKMSGKKESALMFLSLVISGAAEFVEKSKDEILAMAVNEVHRYFPKSAVAHLVHSLVIKEKRATFSPRVGLEHHRPSHTTSFNNLFLAGDWTDTKLPATIEGAAQSGYACGELVEKRLKIHK